MGLRKFLFEKRFHSETVCGPYGDFPRTVYGSRFGQITKNLLTVVGLLAVTYFGSMAITGTKFDFKQQPQPLTQSRLETQVTNYDYNPAGFQLGPNNLRINQN
jgi:hypothetical protein